MAYNIERIHVEQGRIVRVSFVDTADDNYIASRWCFVEGLKIDYFWLAVHALEKYMKAVLLLNGKSGKIYVNEAGEECTFRHNIMALYGEVNSLASDLLPSTLEQPDQLEIRYWHDEAPETFLRRLYRDGNADNRYQIYGFVQRPDDLFKLDMMVFSLRRLCVPLDAYVFGKKRQGKTNLTHREELEKLETKWSLSPTCKLEKTASGKRGEQLQEVLLNLNLPFAPDNYQHDALRSTTTASISVLAQSILKPLERAPDSLAGTVAAEVCDWVIENISLPAGVKNQLGDARTKWESMRHSNNGS